MSSALISCACWPPPDHPPLVRAAAKPSLHLGEKEILDQKVNCGERSEDYGNNDSAPEQGGEKRRLVTAHTQS